jgi:hypothetical protein
MTEKETQNALKFGRYGTPDFLTLFSLPAMNAKLFSLPEPAQANNLCNPY